MSLTDSGSLVDPRASVTPAAALQAKELSPGVWLADRYRLDAALGRGRVATTYRAWDRRLENDVIVKVLRSSLMADGTFREQLFHELRVLLPLAHPHLTKVLNLEVDQGRYVVVTQYFPGGSIEDRRPISRERGCLPKPPHTLFPWLTKIAEALDAIHAHGCVYGNLNATKILFSTYENVYLCEFVVNLAAHRAALRGGSSVAAEDRLLACFPAPELESGAPLTGKVDQYALARLAQDLLTGSTTGGTAQASSDGWLTDATRQVLRRALATAPQDRFATCAEFAAELQAAADVKSPGQVRRTEINNGTSACPVCGTSLYLSDSSRGIDTFCPRCHSALHISEQLSWVYELRLFRMK
ncbi:MAG: protein kinase [Planctomycetaceae bacterium]|nr:protein kinase [Planctomycetaceae bacterium]